MERVQRGEKWVKWLLDVGSKMFCSEDMNKEITINYLLEFLVVIGNMVLKYVQRILQKGI